MTETTIIRERPLFAGLDALRGYAALIVVLFHAGTRTALPLAPGGYLAVDLFFVMSGVVIAYSYDATRLATLGFGGFARARVIRFLPLYVLGLVLGLVLMLALVRFGNGPPIALRDALVAAALNVLFLPAPPHSTLGGDMFPLNVPAWSLMFELAINFAYAALVLRRAAKVFAPLAALSGVALVWFAIRDGTLAGGTEWRTFDVGLARVAFSFPLGVLLYRHRARLPDLGRFGPLVPPLLLVLLWLPTSATRDLAFVLLVSPLMVLVAFRATPMFGSLTKFLAATSYAIYILHYPVLAGTAGIANRLGINAAWPVAAAVVALLIGCYALDKLFDVPLRRWLLRFGRPTGALVR